MTTPVSNPTTQEQLQYLEYLANTPGVDPEQKAFAQGVLANVGDLPEAQITEALSELFGVAPDSNVSPAEIRAQMDSVLARYDAAASGEAVASSVYMTPEVAAKALAKLAVELSFQRQQDARDQAAATRELRVAHLQNAANLMRDEADSIRSAATKQLVLGIVSGAASVAGGVVSGLGSANKLEMQGLQADINAGTLDASQTAAAYEQIGEASNSWSTAWADSATSIGQGTSTGFNAWNESVGQAADADQADLRADQKDEESYAEMAREGVDTASKISDSTAEFARAMIENLRQINEAQNIRIVV